MSSEYYSLEKAAEVLALPTAEVNRLREKNQLRAFRDGSSWKFRKVDVDNYLAESIKNRGKTEKSASESDFDLLSMDDEEESPTLLADLPSFDSLMEDGLSFGDEMIDAAPAAQSTSKITLGKNVSDQDSDLSLADDDLMLSSDDLVLSEDSDILPDSIRSSVSEPSASDIDLAADNDLVLDGSGSSGQLDLAGDSGLSLLDVADNIDLQPVEKGGSDVQLELDDDDDILSLVDDQLMVEKTSTIAIPIEDDFQLTPDAGFISADDSESASQVIALDEDNMFATPGGSSGFGTEMPFAPATPIAEESSQPGIGLDAAPFAAGPTDFNVRSPEIVPHTTEITYTVGHIVWIVLATIFLIFPGMMIMDLIIHIWSWGEPFVINSSIMDLVVGMFQK
ncbi:MAG: helix-turn-helix domain-containing protein [Planctomycetaceae bacterium]|jgi:excisionase family DNA binding protein|nr:helix-turn-helix domain-containing protein [Planctomycetaceae bacterium]